MIFDTCCQMVDREERKEGGRGFLSNSVSLRPSQPIPPSNHPIPPIPCLPLSQDDRPVWGQLPLCMEICPGVLMSCWAKLKGFSNIYIYAALKNNSSSQFRSRFSSWKFPNSRGWMVGETQNLGLSFLSRFFGPLPHRFILYPQIFCDCEVYFFCKCSNFTICREIAAASGEWVNEFIPNNGEASHFN